MTPEQSARRHIDEQLEACKDGGALPFGYESTGAETRFTSGLDPVPASRRVFTSHPPETLAHWHDGHVEGRGAGVRAGIPLLPELDAGARAGVSTAESAVLKRLGQENSELRRANEILQRVAALFG